MSESKKYKTFAELKGPIVSSQVSVNRKAEMIADLDDFVKKINFSQNKVNIKGEILTDNSTI